MRVGAVLLMRVTDRIHLVLDGLQDPSSAQELSRRWSEAGLYNIVDPAGQSAWIAPGQGTPSPLTEADVCRAAAIARSLAVTFYDRTGRMFRNDVALIELRDHVTRDYRRRCAVAFMFGLPAVALHYAAPFLAGSQSVWNLAVPWLLELLLVGWACFAAGWPVLWHGVLALVHRRACGDLLTSAVIVISFVPSVIAVAGMAFGIEPWFVPDGVPLCHATALTLWIALTQRWMLHRSAARLSGRAAWMPRGFRSLVVLWLVVVLFLAATIGWEQSVAFGMLLPPLLSLGAINRCCPGWSVALPVFAFSPFLLLAPRSLSMNVDGIQIEIAAGFSLIMTATFVLGWRGVVKAVPSRKS